MKSLVVHFFLLASVGIATSQTGSVSAHPRTQRVAKVPSLSLCQLTKHMNRYVGRTVRVRLIILGIGGHSPFFIAAQDCQYGTVTVVWASFNSQQRIDGQLESKFLRAVNSDRDKPQSESLLIGRVSNFAKKNSSGYKLMIVISDVETAD